MVFKPSKINANIIGRAAAPAEKKFNGDLTELRIAVGHRKQTNGEWVDNGTSWVTYKANGEYGAALDAVGKGDLVEIVDAALEAREYESKSGNKGLALEARFGKLNILERKSDSPGDTPVAVASEDDSW